MQGAREAPVGKEQQLARLRLCDAARSTLWCFGDWWAYGEHRYGDRKALVESEDWFGPTFQTCADAAWVCQKFETSRRREVLQINYHREVAALPRRTADRLLAWCEDRRLARR